MSADREAFEKLYPGLASLLDERSENGAAARDATFFFGKGWCAALENTPPEPPDDRLREIFLATTIGSDDVKTLQATLALVHELARGASPIAPRPEPIPTFDRRKREWVYPTESNTESPEEADCGSDPHCTVAPHPEYERGRREALEEAARVCDAEEFREPGYVLASRIRSIIAAKPEQ